jgi:tetratricopeptide (TPR) repeat protein
VLEEALQEFGHRLSPFQTARVWRALARNKAASDPKGCVAAFTKAKQLTAAHAQAAPFALAVPAAHPSSSASAVAAAAAADRAAGSGVSSDARLVAVEGAAALTDGSMDASDWLDGGRLSGDDHVALAAATATLGDFGAAVKECRQALAKAPARADLYVHLAGALGRELGVGSWPLAATTAMDTGSGTGTRHLSEAFLVSRLGGVGASAARAFAASAASAAASDSGVLRLGSSSSSSSSSWSGGGGGGGAQAAASEAESRRSADSEGWRELCEAYEEAQSLDPRAMSSAAHYLLGLGRLCRGDGEGALSAFSAACRLDPHSIDALLQVALVLDRFSGDKERRGEPAHALRSARELALKAFQRVGAAMLAHHATSASGSTGGLLKNETPQQAASRREGEEIQK